MGAVVECGSLLWGKPYLCLKLKTVLSTQLEADISHIPTLGRKIDASRWRNTAVLTSHSPSADSTCTSTKTGSLPVPAGTSGTSHLL